MVPLLLCAVLAQTQTAALSPHTIKDVEGSELTLPYKDAKLTVLLFMAVDCPISNRYAPELGRIHKDFSTVGVKFVRVYVDNSVSRDEMLQHAKDFKMPSAGVLDEKHVLVKQLGMTVTPEVAVVAPDGTLKYRGRIDDLYLEHGRVRDGEYRHDLREALEETLAGLPVSKPFTTAIGCGIPDF